MFNRLLKLKREAYYSSAIIGSPREYMFEKCSLIIERWALCLGQRCRRVE
jgi:hypothetical protein